MPGAGKSTVGHRLARTLGLPFVDSDEVLEARIGCTIALYFEHRGEAAFRAVEEQVVEELSAGAPAVLSTGGGSVLRQVNRQRLHARCRVVYLHALPATVRERLRNDTRRPLLQVADPQARLADLYSARDALYRETAHAVVDTEGCASVRQLEERVLAALAGIDA